MTTFRRIHSTQDILQKNLEFLVEKGKKGSTGGGLPEGTIKEWGGQKYIKRAGQWVSHSTGKPASKEEFTGTKKEKSPEDESGNGAGVTQEQGGGPKKGAPGDSKEQPKGEGGEKKPKKLPEDHAKETPSEHLHKYAKEGKDEGLKKVAKKELEGRGELSKEPTKNKAFHGKTVELKDTVNKLNIGGDVGKSATKLRDHLKDAEHAFLADDLEGAANHLSQAEYESKKIDRVLDTPQTRDLVGALFHMNNQLDQKLYGKKGKEGVFKGEGEKLTYIGKKIAGLPFDQEGREAVKKIVGSRLGDVTNMGTADTAVLNAGLQYQREEEQRKKELKEEMGNDEVSSDTVRGALQDQESKPSFSSEKNLSLDDLEKKHGNKSSGELKKIASDFKKKMDKFATEIEEKGEADGTYTLAHESKEWRDMNSYYNKLSELEFRAGDREALQRGETL